MTSDEPTGQCPRLCGLGGKRLLCALAAAQFDADSADAGRSSGATGTGSWLVGLAGTWCIGLQFIVQIRGSEFAILKEPVVAFRRWRNAQESNAPTLIRTTKPSIFEVLIVCVPPAIAPFNQAFRNTIT